MRQMRMPRSGGVALAGVAKLGEFSPAVNGRAAQAISISLAAAVCGAAKALPVTAKGRGWRSGGARLASRRELLADQSTTMHGRAIGPRHHGAHTKSIPRGLWLFELKTPPTDSQWGRCFQRRDPEEDHRAIR
jgi:hypothetical protein